LLERQVDPEAGVLSQLNRVRKGKRLRATDQDLIAAGDEVKGRGRMPEGKAVHVNGGAWWLRLHREPELPCPAELSAKLVEPLPVGWGERVWAHHLPGTHPEDRPERVIGRLATAQAVERHPADELCVGEDSPALRAGREALQLGDGLVEQCQRVADPVV